MKLPLKIPFVYVGSTLFRGVDVEGVPKSAEKKIYILYILYIIIAKAKKKKNFNKNLRVIK